MDGDGLVSVHELYDYVHEQVRRRVADQTPTLSVDSARGTIHLARNPLHGDIDLLAEARAAVRAPQAWQRIGSLHLVERLLGSVREATREVARSALLDLVGDNDPEVARRARKLWHLRGLGPIPTAPGPAEPAGGRPDAPGARIVGIDFGTTNSAIGVFDGDDVRLIPNAEGALTTPSLVAIAADGSLLVGTPAKRQALTNPDHTVRSAKLRLGTDWSITRGGVRLTAGDVARLILARLRADAEAHLGGPVGGAVLTVPATYGLDQRAALVRAGEEAGLSVVRMVNEPTAAAITYGLDREDSSVLVFDLGGGTLDVSLLEVGDNVVEVRATAGDSHLGGDDWDQRIVDHLVARVRARHGIDLADDIAAMRRLREAAETAKIELSAAHTTALRLPCLAAGPRGPLHLEETLTREEFETITRDLLARCRRPVEHAVADAGLALADIDRVILTGGAARTPAVGELVRRLTGDREPYRGLIPEGVVTGAALHAGVLSGSVKDVLLLDVCSLSIGVEVRGGAMVKLIERNTTIPTSRSEYFSTHVDDQPALVLRFVEGERREADANRTLAILELPLPPAPAGTPEIEVTAVLDPNGILSLKARDLGTGQLATAVANHVTIRQATERARSPRWADLRRFAPEPPNPSRRDDDGDQPVDDGD
ncbi:Hsp70 family protein [Streptomyces profundus]|nr:Hsp70 family protein [Streptomyces sp. MA3_2.13]